MTKREQFDEILDSYSNGQNKQMTRQLDELGGYETADFIEYLEEIGRADEVPELMKRYFRIKYR